MRALPLALLLPVALLTACSGSDDPTPQDAATQVAKALTSGTLPTDLFTGTTPQTAYDAVVAGLGEDAAPRVKVASVDQQDGSRDATARLAWRWDLGGSVWSYQTEVPLRQDATDRTWTATWSPAVVEASLTDGEKLETHAIAPSRGDILGARGVALVTERPVVRYGLDKTKVKPAQAVPSARLIAAELDVAPAPFVKAVRAAGAKAFVEALVLRQADAGQVDPASYGRIPGAVALAGSLPLAPSREFAAPILGRVGPATAELIEKSDGRLSVGDTTGLSGLQARYDEQLTGTPGLQVEAVSDDGSRKLFGAPAKDGTPLRTTLDTRLQLKAERVLAVADPERPGPATALVAIRPSTGAILAAASGPGADGQNLATYGQYAPGSTFKLVSSLALLRSGLTPTSTVPCPASVTVDGKVFENYDDYPAGRLGPIPLRDAVANSCNTAFISERARVRGDDLASAAAALGLGVDHDLGFPAYFGQVPPPAGETERAADLIGQGKILASPLAMATVAASIRAGHVVVPHLLAEFTPTADPAAPLTAQEASQLQALMHAVVTDGSGRLLAGLPGGGTLGAKTGTAEYGEPGPGGKLPTHAWMVATQGDLAVAVFVETGASGSGTAGPLLLRFLS